MSDAIHLISAWFALLGALVIFVAMIGVVRFPDVFCRAHALGKGMTLGISLMLLSLWIDQGTQAAGLKILAAIFFQFLTLPVASHLLALLARQLDFPRFGPREIDDHRAAKGAGRGS